MYSFCRENSIINENSPKLSIGCFTFSSHSKDQTLVFSHRPNLYPPRAVKPPRPLRAVINRLCFKKRQRDKKMDSFTDKQSIHVVELHQQEEEKSQNEATLGEVKVAKISNTTTTTTAVLVTNLFPVTETLSDPTTATDTQSSNSTSSVEIPIDDSVLSFHSSSSRSERSEATGRVEICLSKSDTFSKEGTTTAETGPEVEVILSRTDSNSSTTTTCTHSQFLDNQSPSTAHLPVKMIDMFQHSFLEPTMIDSMDMSTMESTSSGSPLDLPKKELDPVSRPYAQLCFDPQEKTLVTMLEVTVADGSGKCPRFCLDLPSAEEFPWLGETIMSESSSTDESDSSEERMEPIVLSGWMMDKDYLPEADADLYWLLSGGSDDPRVRAGDELGCSKVLRKLLFSCSKWKLRSIDYGRKDCSNEKESFFKYEVLG